MSPFVSIIIPLKNEEGRIRELLQTLLALDYPKDRFEIVVADNGSTDQTREIAGKFAGVVVCVEPRGGSYAARNCGVKGARGEILAFTDGDCTPEAGWLKGGVAKLQGGADLVAGAIHLELSSPTLAHRFDQKFFLQQQQWVKEKKAGATANLFVKREVFEQLGGFSEALTSGGDFAFCKAAAAAGFCLEYEPTAVVRHPTRGFRALLKKAKRIGGGKVERLRHTATTSREVVPGGGHLVRLLANERPGVQLGFGAIYLAVCLAGALGAALALLAQARSGGGEHPRHPA